MATMMVAATAQASGRYLRHPVFQNLPTMEVRMETQFGYGDTGDLPFGLLGAFGIGIGDALTIGVYGQLFTSDRDLPVKMETVYGLGGFGEYAIQIGYAVTPYIGMRIGMLDPTGPASPTVPYVGGIAGLKYPLTDVISLSASVTVHWAGDDGAYEAYNYKRSGSGYSADTTDVTFDAGLRYAF
jgi:hypothetical protein